MSDIGNIFVSLVGGILALAFLASWRLEIVKSAFILSICVPFYWSK